MKFFLRSRFWRAAGATLTMFLQPLTFAHSADQRFSDMVRINAGQFLMGSDDGPEDEQPMHKISLAEFHIDRHQVTHAQLAWFLDAVGTESARGEKYFDIGDETATHRGRHVSRNFRSGHHNIGFRCAR